MAKSSLFEHQRLSDKLDQRHFNTLTLTRCYLANIETLCSIHTHARFTSTARVHTLTLHTHARILTLTLCYLAEVEGHEAVLVARRLDAGAEGKNEKAII